jgi:teichuronic acid biosynthesis glycosyltransferase TuaC
MFPCKRHPTSAIFFANLIKELSRRVDEITVITPRVYIPKTISKLRKNWSKWRLDPMVSDENNIHIIRPFVIYFVGTIFTALNAIILEYSLYFLVRNLINKRKIEIILGYNMMPEGFTAVRLAKMFKLPVAFWAIGSDVNTIATHNLINYKLAKKCIRETNLVITESKDLEDIVKKFHEQPISVKTFYKGINLANFKDLPPKPDLLKLLNLSEKRKYILFVGRIIQDKGIYELAQSFCAIAKLYPDLDLIMIGEEIEKEQLISYFNKAGIQNRIHFWGIVTHQEIAYFMKISELLVLPSWHEGLPNVVMEAMASELPVIASNVGGVHEVLTNGITGISIPAKNANQLTIAITTMLTDEKLRVSCISNAKKLIFDKFDVKKNSLLLHNILKEIIDVNRA